MSILAALAIGAFAQGADDPLERRIRALVERIESDDLDRGHVAIAELILLGPKAAPAIHSEASKATSDTRLKLEEVLRKIDREVRLRKAVGEPVKVSIEAQGRPFQEVIQELKRKGGQPLQIGEYDPRTPITLSLKDVPFWEALQAACKAEGKTEWWVEPGGNRIRFGEKSRQNLPILWKGNVAVRFNDLHFGRAISSDSLIFCLSGDVVSTAGSRPSFAWFEVESWEDDKGRSLKKPQRDYLSGSTVQSDDAPEDRIRIQCTWWPGEPVPDPEATKILRLRGKVHFRYVLATRSLLRLGGVQKLGGTAHGLEEMKLDLKSIDIGVEGGKASIQVSAAKDIQGRVRELSYLLRDGRTSRVAQASMHGIFGGAEDMTLSFDLDWTWGKGYQPVEFEVVCPDEVEDMEIPFELRDITLRP